LLRFAEFKFSITPLNLNYKSGKYWIISYHICGIIVLIFNSLIKDAIMFSSPRIDSAVFNKNWSLFLVWGILLVLLGAIAISTSVLTTIISMIFIGVLLIVGGIVIMIDAFTFWRKHLWSSFALHFLIGLLYFGAGIMLVDSPLAGSISLTLILGLFYLIIGIIRIISSLSTKQPRWGWNFFSGVIGMLLGIMIIESWPVSGTFVIGLFVGIDLLFIGFVYIMGALGARALLQK
jgi:uncharacterized membrane protein HdeD (DUF308 family)